MKNKKLLRISGVLLIILIFVGVIIWGLFTGLDRNALESEFTNTTAFTKAHLQNYEEYTANDRVKSLVRLLDKTEELGNDIENVKSYSQKELDDYVVEQRLTGALVLDKKLNIVFQSTNTKYLWEEIKNKDYIKEILEHSEETYTERIEVKDTSYDLAVIARQDAKGLIVAYAQKDTKSVGDMTISSIFADFPISMDGVIVVSLDDKVVSTNQKKILGKTTKELQKIYSNSFKENTEKIIHTKINNKVWYGSKDKMGEYTLYVFFPSSQVFLTRSIACGLYVAVAILTYLLLLLIYSNIEKVALRQSQKRMRIINALGTAYSSITLFNLVDKKAEMVKKADDNDPVPNTNLFSKESLEQHVSKAVDKRYSEKFLEFIDMDTVTERLKGHRSLTYTMKMANGKWLLSIIVPQRFDKDGNIVAVLLANRDVTKEKEKELEQENELRNALAVAEHANKAKTNFLNSISHDIRTPMNAVIGFTALAITHIDNKDVVVDYLKKINISGQHLLSLINDVLDMSRIESGSVKLEEVKVHLPDVFHDLRSIIQGNICSKQQDLYIDTQNVVHENIITDKLRLNQVLLNIVSNAIKFTPSGGMINIRVTESPSGREGFSTYSFSVKDNGIGMSKEFQEHIFDTFAREQTVTKSGIQGTGLGMSISKNIVNMMGGTIDVKSETGKGSEFIVTIDCKVSEEIVRHKPIPELEGARALVVDDDVNTCMSVSKMLRDIEMVADWTTSGKEAVLRAKEAFEMKKEFKVYIIDWQMPDINGIETVRRIRKVIGDDIPIIILTAYDWADIEEEAREAGVTAFIAKPLFMSELRNALTMQVAKEEVEELEVCFRHVGKKVLLVEDNELNSEIAISLLEEAGLIVESVEDGIDAVERMNEVDESKYDFILMDIQMPTMDGYTATREIRTLKNNKKANIPIIAMTANAFEEDRQKAFAAGMNEHISKPISIDVIMHVLDKVFDEN